MTVKRPDTNLVTPQRQHVGRRHSSDSEMQLLVDFDGSLHSLNAFRVEEISSLSYGEIERLVVDKFRLPCEDFYLVNSSGHVVPEVGDIELKSCEPTILRLKTRILGGKGGFGSQLKGGAGGYGFGDKKNTSISACRDLTGRRIRHIENDHKMRAWKAGEQGEKERELEDKLRTEKKRLYEETVVKELPPEKKKGVDMNELKRQEEEARSTISESLKTQSRKKKPKIVEKDEESEDEIILGLEDIYDEPDTGKSKSSSSPSSNSSPIMPIPAQSSPKEDKQQTINAVTESQAPLSDVELDLSKVKSTSELEELGLDRLKVELAKRGLKFGGTLHQRAVRLLTVKGLEPEDYPAKLRNTK